MPQVFRELFKILMPVSKRPGLARSHSLRSMMTEKEVMEKVNLQHLSNAEVEEIFSVYNPTPKLLIVK